MKTAFLLPLQRFSPLFEIRFLSKPQVPVLVFFPQRQKIDQSFPFLYTLFAERCLDEEDDVCVWLLTLLLATLNGSYFSPSLLLGEEC